MKRFLVLHLLDNPPWHANARRRDCFVAKFFYHNPSPDCVGSSLYTREPLVKSTLNRPYKSKFEEELILFVFVSILIKSRIECKE